MVFGCLVPGPGIIKAEEYCLSGYKGQMGEGVGGEGGGRGGGLGWLVCISEACFCLDCSLGKLSLLSEKDFVIGF